MRSMVFIVMMLGLYGCTYSLKVNSISDTELCSNLGYYYIYDNASGIEITQKEIDSRNLDKNVCSGIANKKIEELIPKYKLKLCQNLAEYHYKGAYSHFKKTVDRIRTMDFADEECNTMADFYLIRLSRKQEKAQAISSALKEAAENIKRTNEQLHGKGTQFNPIHINIQ